MMAKNKIFHSKSGADINFEFIARLFLAALLVFLILKACGKIDLFDSDKKYIQSFGKFVDGINEMTIIEETFSLELKEKAAVIGFSRNSEYYECINCYGGMDDKAKIVVEKPITEECTGNSCICLCDGGFELQEKEFKGQQVKFGQCQNVRLQCRPLRWDIIDIMPIGNLGKEYWKNGFLFTNSVSGANGLKTYEKETTTFKVGKVQNIIGVCNLDMKEFNKNELGIDKCITKESEEEEEP